MGMILPSRFEPIRLLRKDRVCSTFIATDRRLGRNEVVVKVIGRGNFTRDTANLTDALSWYHGLRHPFISEVLDAGLTPKRDLFCVRPFHAASEFFAARSTVSLKRLISAVDFLHSRGRVHGSIKPTNIFSTGDEVHLADAWIGQDGPDRPRILNEEGVRFGAPETWNSAAVSRESDLYSVGALIYRYFSGRDPFEDSDLESLKAKYAWASPRPLTSVSHVSKAIGDIVANLLHRDPDRRKAAFEALKEELEVLPTTALRAPLVGLTSQVAEALGRLLDGSGPRVVFVEGPAGSGKSRFVGELQTLVSFRERTVAVCEATAPDLYASLARRVVALIDEQHLSVGAACLSRIRRFMETGREPALRPEQEEMDRDLVSLLASISRQSRLLLVIEDIDRTSRRLVGLLETIVRQLTELDVSIVVTSRPEGISLKATKVLTEFLGERLHRMRLELLSPADSDTLSLFFASDPDRRIRAAQKAGGNPSFLEDYCRDPKPVVPRRVRKTLSNMILKLPRRTRRVAEVLSLFEQSIDWNVLSSVAGTPESDLHESVVHLERIGLVDAPALTIRYPDARTLLHSRIPKPRRAELHAQCFHSLKEAGYKDGVLAYHAFQGTLFHIAASLYCRLARERFAAKDYGGGGEYYNLAGECCARDPEVSPLDPADQVKSAKCDAYQGNRNRARKTLEKLLESRIVREDPELLSSVYAALALPLIEDSSQKRIRLLDQSIACLPRESSETVRRFRALTTAFLSAGDLEEADRALKEVETLSSSSEDLQQLDNVRASVLINQGAFKDAARRLSDRWLQGPTPGGVSNNLAVCLEQLGELKRARGLQLVALREAQANGSLFLQVVSLNNLGSMETKLGNLGAAEKFFALALGKVRELQRQDGEAGRGKFGATYADAASHSIQKGDYRTARENLDRISPEYAGPFPLEIFLYGLTRCELYIALAQPKRAAEALEATRRLPLSGDFFDVERLLVEARLQVPSLELCGRLERALVTSRRQGTLYQECRVAVALATVLLSTGDFRKASDAARLARKISRKNEYKPLAARALLLMGLSAEREIEREFGLKKSLDEAAEMGLTPFVAECAFHLGAWRFGRGDYAGARDYLSKSASITALLAEALSSADQRTYLAAQPHREGRRLLNEASEKAMARPERLPELLDKESSYFLRLYRLSAAMTAAVDLTAALATLLQTLKQAMNHSSIVCLGSGSRMAFHSTRPSLPEEVKRRVLSIAGMGGEKPYITGIGTTRKRDAAVWIPIMSLALRGGIYVESLPGQTTLDEREMEFLTIVAAVAGAALDRVCSKEPGNTAPFSGEFHGIVGGSRQIREVQTRIEIAATNAATLLIEGESGTGKELVARAVHELSSRAKAPFIPVDCGALPEGLIEAELFGSRKGAYTGALTDQPGLFEAADHGTIFLDEISNLGLTAQAKLLRVLQEREVRRIGSPTGKAVDVRLIAATNSNLEKLVRDGKFRQDLLYRLKVLHVLLPPLRDRKTDIPVLATAFLERLNTANQSRKYFGPRVMERLQEHDYPGNVRELQNTIERGFYSTKAVVIAQVDFLREASSIDSPGENETESWFRDLTEGRKEFWSAVHDRYKRRDISRERLIALIDCGLRVTRGNYKTMASMLQITKDEYHRFMDFLRRNRCLLDFRPYRRLDDSSG